MKDKWRQYNLWKNPRGKNHNATGLHSDIFLCKIFGSGVDLAGIVNSRSVLCHIITFLGISDGKIPRAMNKVKVRLLCFSLFPYVVPMEPGYFSFLLTC